MTTHVRCERVARLEHEVEIDDFESLQGRVVPILVDENVELSEPPNQLAECFIKLLESWSEPQGIALLLGALSRLCYSLPDAVFSREEARASNPQLKAIESWSEVLESLPDLSRLHLGHSDPAVKIAAAHMIMQRKSADLCDVRLVLRELDRPHEQAVQATLLFALGVAAERCGELLVPHDQDAICEKLAEFLGTDTPELQFAAACGLAFLRRPLAGDALLAIARGSLRNFPLPEQWYWFDLSRWCNTGDIAERVLSWVRSDNPEPALNLLLREGDPGTRVSLHLAFYCRSNPPAPSGIALSELSQTQFDVLRKLTRDASSLDRACWNDQQLVGLGFNPARIEQELSGFLQAKSTEWAEIPVTIGSSIRAWPVRRVLLAVGKGDLGVSAARQALLSAFSSQLAMQLVLRTQALENRVLRRTVEQQRLQDLCSEIMNTPDFSIFDQISFLRAASDEIDRYTLADLRLETWKPSRVRVSLCFSILSKLGTFPESEDSLLKKALNDAMCDEPLRAVVSALPRERVRQLLAGIRMQGKCFVWDLCADWNLIDEVGEFLSDPACGLSKCERIKFLSRGDALAQQRWQHLKTKATEVFDAVDELLVHRLN